ncbi:Cof-type HAD-IIB family hydrolase [Clostridium sp. D2Q-11]|uniref:Cof-type HAD-IIB family hydrolase n=1 Tax=Anaeromonas frigoriresistens TaxID=2683708 RepID=A0A942V0B4_9FIRM|nr:Cof-type HAD-IIB family hydrolase [Anaeromonas frigoriresistens]MBS4539551.1 Cof-type HAD-IIB family hydrolase [Anaeromonas frigoriresistens]
MDYKLVAIDLDGTLLTDDKEISKDNLDTLRSLIDKGIEVIIATGRRYWSAKKLIENLNMNIIIISNNGNIVRRVKDDKILIEKYLDLKDFNMLLREGKKLNLHPILHTNSYEKGWDFVVEYDINDKRYKNYISSEEKRYKRIRNFIDYEDDKILVACYLDEYKKLDSFIKEIENKYPNKFSYHIMRNLNKSGPILEVMNPLGSKWNSIMEYANEKDIMDKEIITIGDDNNDVEMLKESGLGIAMKNGCNEAKQSSDIISSRDNNNSGVAFELKRIFDI